MTLSLAGIITNTLSIKNILFVAIVFKHDIFLFYDPCGVTASLRSPGSASMHITEKRKHCEIQTEANKKSRNSQFESDDLFTGEFH